MNNFEPPAPAELPFSRYEALLVQARDLVTNALAADVVLNFDTALTHAQTFEAACRMPVAPLGNEPALTGMSDAEVFRLAESLDTVMSYAHEDNRLMAATIANDVHASLFYSPAGAKSLILDKVLGIKPSSVETVPEQIARRYFTGTTVNEQKLTAQDITRHSRMTPEAR